MPKRKPVKVNQFALDLDRMMAPPEVIGRYLPRELRAGPAVNIWNLSVRIADALERRYPSPTPRQRAERAYAKGILERAAKRGPIKYKDRPSKKGGR